MIIIGQTLSIIIIIIGLSLFLLFGLKIGTGNMRKAITNLTNDQKVLIIASFTLTTGALVWLMLTLFS